MRQARALGAAFVSANRQGSRWLGARLPQRKEDAHLIYLDALAGRLAWISGPAVLVDVGGGRQCHVACFRPPGAEIRIVAVDISPDELAANQDVDETRVADVTKELPFGPATVDLVSPEAFSSILRTRRASSSTAPRRSSRGAPSSACSRRSSLRMRSQTACSPTRGVRPAAYVVVVAERRSD